jgi:hypothetical protein
MFSSFKLLDSSSISTLTDAAHRIFIIDCSGSMTDTLPDLCRHLKNKLGVLTKPTDFVSILWFKHAGCYGCLQEHIHLADVVELSLLHQSLDHYLHANGGTHFTQSIDLAYKIAQKYQEPTQVFFMTDGCENQQSTATVAMFERLSTVVASIVLVEYGWYTDSEYMKKLSHACNGVHIFSKDFSKLSALYDKYLYNPVASNVKQSFATREHCFAILNQECKVWWNTEYTMSSNNASVTVEAPPGTLIYKCASDMSNKEDVHKQCQALVQDEKTYYAYLWYAVVTRQPDLAWALLKASGDVYFMNKYNTVFSKQDLAEMVDDIQEAYADATKRFSAGRDTSAVPRDDTFTVLDLLQLLQQDEDARVWPYHAEFSYERIAKRTVRVGEEDGDKFVANKDVGCPITLVYNATRANVNMNCLLSGFRKNGTPDEQYRNYAVIKDGVKHVLSLPVSVSRGTFERLQHEQLISTHESFDVNRVYVLNLSSTPIINRKMTQGKLFSITEFGVQHVKRVVLQAQKKYLSSRLKQLELEEAQERTASKRHKGVDTVEEEEEEEEPKVKVQTVRSGDSYMARELLVKVAKCSSLPAVDRKLLAKLSSGGGKKKLTTTEQMMKSVHDEYELAKESGKNMNKWIEERLVEVVQQQQENNKRLEEVKFVLLAANLWFHDYFVVPEGTSAVCTSEYEGVLYKMDICIRQKEVQI